jgi:hypothetical protein
LSTRPNAALTLHWTPTQLEPASCAGTLMQGAYQSNLCHNKMVQ